jgi:beta-lactamase superfamily II metal-dependent hydrolase
VAANISRKEGMMLEIDIIGASTAEKGADCIFVRYGEFNYEGRPNNQEVVLIDGGYAGNAPQIKEHLFKLYNTRQIDIMINSHPDQDHINGLIEILKDKEIIVKELWVHNPWEHKYSIFRKVRDRRVTPNSIEARLDDTLSALDELLFYASQRPGLVLREPFTDTISHRFIKILSPSLAFYAARLNEFPGMPNEIKPKSGGEKMKLVTYNPEMEHFIDNPMTSPKNNTSTIIKLDYPGYPAIFTGDSGVEAIVEAYQYSVKNKIDIKAPTVFQLPHHGSIKNVNKSIIDYFSPKYFFVSSPEVSEKHPSQPLSNYIVLQKTLPLYKVYKNVLRFSKDSPNRLNWSAADSESPLAKVKALKKEE